MKVASIAVIVASSIFILTSQANPADKDRINENSLFSWAKADAISTRKYCIQHEKWSIPEWRASKCIEVTVGNKSRIYTWQGKLVKTRKTQVPTQGIMGNYAEVDWELLNQKMQQFSDIFGQSVVHFHNGKWHFVASASSADGYGNQLKKAKVPAAFIKRLQG